MILWSEPFSTPEGDSAIFNLFKGLSWHFCLFIFGQRRFANGHSYPISGAVLGQTLRLVTAGLIAGIAASLLATRALSSLLFHIGNYDPLTFVAIALLLSLVALFAGYLPARRATKVDNATKVGPMVALRYE